MYLAGTAPRGKTEEEDNDIKQHLQHDEKNLQEHDFVVQMIRKSIERDCTDIDIPEKPIVRQLKHVQHPETVSQSPSEAYEAGAPAAVTRTSNTACAD